MKISEAANTKQPRSKAKSKQAKPSRRTKPAAASREQEPPSSHPPAAGRSTRSSALRRETSCDSDADDESEGEHRIEALVRAMEMQGGGVRASRVLVKWEGLPPEEGTWEPRKHLHPEALADFEWGRALPFALFELLELAPHAPLEVLAREGLLPVPERELSETESDGEGEDGGGGGGSGGGVGDEEKAEKAAETAGGCAESGGGEYFHL